MRMAKRSERCSRRARREGIKRKRRRWGGRGVRRKAGGRSTEGEADARASDACVQIITLMRFVESGTKRRGRGGRFGKYLTTQRGGGKM